MSVATRYLLRRKNDNFKMRNKQSEGEEGESEESKVEVNDTDMESQEYDSFYVLNDITVSVDINE